MFNAHSHKFMARLVLVCFALFIGIAIASPIVNPTETQMVCASAGAGGMKMVALGEEGADAKLVSNMDCPLCAAVVLPMAFNSPAFENPRALGLALHPLAAALIASVTAPPLPSRGPPSIS
jgi:hypothetical protein